MVKVSLNTFKHKFFYQILILSIIILSIVVGVSVTSNKSKLFFNKTKAAGGPTCTSWTDFWIEGTGGNCNTYDPDYKYSYPACKTTSRSVTLHMNVANADTMQLLNVDPSLYCTDNRIIWSPEFSAPVSIKPWTINAGLGEKKVCGRFQNEQGEVRCGGMIRYISDNPPPTSTPRPPTPTPTRIPPTSTPAPPCTKCEYSGYRCDGKNAFRCIDKCLIFQGACAPDKSCNADTTHWWCSDNCPDGSYRCYVSGYEYLQKCVDDKWTNIDRCDYPGDECGCYTSPPRCAGMCL